MEKAFGVRPLRAVLGLDLICVFEKEEQVRQMQPDQTLLKEIEGRIQNATAAGINVDCVSRSFCPKLSIAEAPVCGSHIARLLRTGPRFWTSLRLKRIRHPDVEDIFTLNFWIMEG